MRKLLNIKVLIEAVMNYLTVVVFNISLPAVASRNRLIT